jgi:two-component system response regulator NreC
MGVPGTDKLRVFLADDHELVRAGLRMIINGQPDMTVVGEVGDGRRAVHEVPAVRPDVLIMDVSMPQMNGLQATEALLQAAPGTRIIILTRHAEDWYLQRLIRAGVAGYVLKQSRPSELLTAIRTVSSGGQYLDPAVSGVIMHSYSQGPADVPAGLATLAPREREVLRLISRGYSNKQIAERLDLSVKTVESHKANATRKLNLRSRIDIVRFAMLQGWLDEA